MINEVVKCWLDLSRNLVVMNGCESWTIKKAEHQELMLSNCDAREDSWEFSDCMEIKPVNPKGNQPWIFIGRTDAEAETPILWPPDEKSRLIGKDPDAGKDWGQEEKGVAEDEMVRWHHQLNGHEYGQTQGDGEGQGGLACCGSWGHKDLDTTERLNHKQFMCILTGAARSVAENQVETRVPVMACDEGAWVLSSIWNVVSIQQMELLLKFLDILAENYR